VGFAKVELCLELGAFGDLDDIAAVAGAALKPLAKVVPEVGRGGDDGVLERGEHFRVAPGLSQLMESRDIG
jgi:hypothetical protein